MNTKLRMLARRVIEKGGAALIATMFLATSVACFGQTPGQPKWNSPVSAAGAVRGSPAIGPDGTIYVDADDGMLYAINPATGLIKPNWPVQLHNTPSYEDELLSSPVIAPNGTIYVASLDRNVYNINPDGSVKWTFAVPSRFGSSYAGSSVAVGADGTVYVAYDDDNLLYAINPQGNNGNASIKWTLELTDRYGDEVYIDSNPSIGPDCTIYFYVSNFSQKPNDDVERQYEKLLAVTDNGSSATIQWTREIGFEEDTDDFRNAPVISADGTVFVPLDIAAQELIALNPDGSGKWKFLTGGTIKSSPAIGPDGTIYFGADDNKLYALNPDGTLKWKFSQATDKIESSPALASDGTLYIGSSDGKLYAINSANGSMIWNYLTGGPIISSPVIGTDGTVYFGSGNAKIYALYGTAGLAASDWPMFRKNPIHTASQSQSVCSPGHCSYLDNPKITDGTYSFDCYGQPNSQYEVFASADLQTWAPLATLTLDTFGYGSFTDDSVTGVAHRFYKLSNGECCSQAIGFERLEIAANSSRYIANQLDAPMNTLEGLFEPMPDGSGLPIGTQITKFKNGSSSTYTDQGGYWRDSSGNIVDTILAPGEGAIMVNNSSSAFTVTFVGLVREGNLTHALASGSNFVSSIIPKKGGIISALGYAPATSTDDIFTIWDNLNQTAVQREYYTGRPGKPAGWYDINGNPVAEPVIDFGESFFVTPSTGDQWVQNYSACPCDVPMVVLTSPADGAAYCPNSSIVLSAEASEACGTINSVSFYANGTLLNTTTTAPYTYTWAGTTPGTYSLTATATDNHGVVATSAPVSIRVGAAVALTSPADGAVYCPNISVVLSAEASDECATINSVSFYANGTLLNTTTTAPYTYTWAGAAPGTYSLTATVIDNHGAVATSTAVSVRVISPPILSDPQISSTGQFSFTATGAANISWTVYASNDGVNWSPIGTLDLGPTGVATFTDPTIPGEQYYKLDDGDCHSDVISFSGALDGTFTGSTDGSIYDVAVQNDGKILIAGDFTEVDGQSKIDIARLNVDGTLDTTFDASSVISSYFSDGANADVYCVAVDSLGRVYFGGDRLDSQGNYLGRMVCVDPSGYLLTGTSQQPDIIDTDGPIFTFSGGGQPMTFSSASVDLTVGGSFSKAAQGPVNDLSDFTTFDYENDLFEVLIFQNDNSFQIDSCSCPPPNDNFPGMPSANAHDNSVYSIGGHAGTAAFIVGGSAPGWTGLEFSSGDQGVGDAVNTITLSGGAQGGPVFGVAVQSNGKILAGGAFSTVGGENHFSLARFNSDGSLDHTFNPPSCFDTSVDTGLVDTINTVLVESDSKIVAGGWYDMYWDGNTFHALQRFNSDGSVDTSFHATVINPAEDEGANVLKTIQQPDGNIIAVGQFSTTGVNQNIVRIHP